QVQPRQTERVVSERCAALVLESQLFRLLETDLKDNGLHEDLPARYVELLDYPFQHVVVLWAGADEERVRVRIGRNPHLADEFAPAAGGGRRPRGLSLLPPGAHRPAQRPVEAAPRGAERGRGARKDRLTLLLLLPSGASAFCSEPRSEPATPS